MDKNIETQIDNIDNEVSFEQRVDADKKRREIYDGLFAPFVSYEQFCKADYQLILLNLAMLIDDKVKFREYLDKTIEKIKQL